MNTPKGPVLVLFGLLIPVVGGKWGSYIGSASLGLFLSDVLLGVGMLATVLSRNRATLTPIRISLFQFCLLLSSVLFCFTEFLISTGRPIVRLRDLSPFVYLLLLPFVAGALRGLDRRVLRRSIDGALTAHAIWAVPAILGLLPSIAISQLSAISVFSTRPDIDVLLIGAYGVFTLPRQLRNPILRTGAQCLLALSGLVQTSRAALGGALAGIAVFYILRHRSAIVGLARFLLFGMTAVLILFTLAATVLPGQLAGGALERAGLVGGSAQASSVASGQGTAGARYEAWKLVTGYWQEHGSPLLGLGPGTEILQDSGAVEFLSGDLDVRSPHNWWVGCLVRFGPVGLVLWCVLVGFGVRYRRRPGRTSFSDDDVFAIGWGLIVSILIAATLGVLIESPFGTQPLLLAVVLTGLCYDIDESAGSKLEHVERATV